MSGNSSSQAGGGWWEGVGSATDEHFPIGDINLNSSTVWLQLYQHQERQCAGGQQEPLEKQRGDEDEIRTHTHTHTPSPVYPDTRKSPQREVLRTGKTIKKTKEMKFCVRVCVCGCQHVSYQSKQS